MNLFNLFATISLDKSDYDKGVKEATEQGESMASKLGGGLAKAGQVAAKGLAVIGTAATGAVAGLLALESSTEEYRVAQGKLNTAFEAAGYGAETAQQAYNAFYGILGDTDTATEASQLLAKLADNEEDVATWTNIAAGVSGTFGDSLPIEGLIEASNETAKVGQVTGVLADALNWAGISEDEFNAKLEACTSESERNNLIMETLSGTYDEASEAFYHNNEALVEARNNQAQLDDTLATLGESVSNVKNSILSGLIPAFQRFVDSVNWDSVEDGVTKFVNAIIDNGPTIISVVSGIGAGFAAWKITNIVQTLITSLGALVPALTSAATAQTGLNTAMAANPIGAVISIIAALVTAIMTLWTTNENFRNAVIGIWENIKNVFSSAWDGIKAIWDAVKPYFEAIWEGIKNVFSVVSNVLSEYFSSAWEGIKTVWNAVTGFFENIWNTIKGIFSVVESVLSGDFESAWEAIKSVFSGWKEFFSGLWDDLTGIFSDIWDFFVGIGEDIVNGIKEGIQNIWDGLVDWFEGIWNGLFGNRKATVEVERRVTGPDIDGSHAGGLGFVPFDGYLAELHKGEMVLTRKQADLLRNMDFGTATVDFASSGLGAASAGMVNGISSAVQGGGMSGPMTINLMLPDGSRLASYLFDPLVNYSRANGTSILSPT